MDAEITNDDSIDTIIDSEKLHLSPRSLIASTLLTIRSSILPLAAAIFTFGRGSASTYIWIAIPILLVIILFTWLAWKRFTYQIGTEEIRIESGILSRNARSIPYERIQDVSVEQKLISRLLGIASVKFETGGGEGDEGKLNYVTLDNAEELRQLVRTRKAAPSQENIQTTIENETVEDTEDKIIFAMDVKRIFTLGMFNFSLVLFAVITGLLQQFDFLLPFTLEEVIETFVDKADENGFMQGFDQGFNIVTGLFGAIGGIIIVIIIGLLSGQVQTFLREYGFTLTQTDRGIRRRRGLLTLTDVVMPLHRVQAAIIQTGPIRKRFGWQALKFTSLGTDTGKESSHMIAPLAKHEEYWPITERASISPPAESLKFKHSHISYVAPAVFITLIFILVTLSNLIFSYADAIFYWIALVGIIPFAAALLSWTYHFHALDNDQIYVKSGFWNRKLTILPMVKVQSIDIAQGPLSQLLGVADMKFGIAGGSGFSALTIHNIPLTIAHNIRKKSIDKAKNIDFSDMIKAPKGS